MRQLIPYVVLVAVVMLAAVAVRAASAWLASRYPPAAFVMARLESVVGLVCAVAVVSCVVAAAVAYPQSALGVYARSPESVEISAIVAAIGAAFISSVRRGSSPT